MIRNLFFALCSIGICSVVTAQVDKKTLSRYQKAGLTTGRPIAGKIVFESEKAGCSKCHVATGNQRKAGPSLETVGDKYSLEQLVQEVLEPSSRIHPDYVTILVATFGGKNITGVLHSRSDTHLTILNNEGKTVSIHLDDIETEKPINQSLMPAELYKSISEKQFSDLMAYLVSLKQKDGLVKHVGLVSEIPLLQKPIRLRPIHSAKEKFDHPVWIVAIPGQRQSYLVVEQKTRKIWRIKVGDSPVLEDRELFVDLSKEATTGKFEGVMCLDFHPQFERNGKYYVNHHVRNQGSHFSPLIIERVASKDRKSDSGQPSRRLLQIPQQTDLHWGGMLAFGPDGYLYIGTGDAGPQEDPEGHGQNMSLLVGKILRIDVNKRSEELPYGIPNSNPYRNMKNVRPEIWASGFRMPWRFSWDSETGDMWVGEIGQTLFEEVSMPRIGENHGWNVYEGFTHFSDRFRRKEAKYTPPVLSYRRKHGVSVTGGYVYRANKQSSFYGAYIFADFESKRIFAATQSDRKLTKIRQIGMSPEKPASFGVDENGELFLVGYEGTLFRVVLDETRFD